MAATTSALRHPFVTIHRAYRGPHGHHNSSEANVGIPFHGSCSRCHHFHNNHQFTFSLDSTVHTRLNCERCSHPMFGLGRASTQNTLASVESGFTFTPRACVDRPGPQPALQVEAQPSASELRRRLTPITERRSPFTSNNPTATPTLVTASPEEASTEFRREDHVESHALPKGDAQRNPEEGVVRLQTVALRLRMIARRLKPRLSAKPRFHRIRSKFTRVGMPHHASTSASTTEVSSSQVRSDNVDERVSATTGDTEDRHALLRARRRELTLAQEREHTLTQKCECSPECQCITGSHVAQAGSDETRDNNAPDDPLSQHHSSTASSNSQPSQGTRQNLYLFHIGGRFDVSRRSSSADESSSATESGSGRISLNQGLTPGSNGSSVSSRARRPLFVRASSMPVGYWVHNPAGVRSSTHVNSPIPEHGWTEDSGTVGASSLIDEGDLPGHISHSASSQNDEASTQQRPTSPANLVGPHEEEPLTNGVSHADHSPAPDGDQITPTPYESVRADWSLDGVLPEGPDGLSSALQGLTDPEATDHDREYLADNHSD